MDIGLIIKIAGIGMLVSFSSQMLARSGRDEQATFVSIAGVIVVLAILIGEIGELFSVIKSVFGLDF
jgi:stage III sporulation protein AC